MAEVMPGPSQKYWTPPGAEPLPFKVTDWVVQVRVLSGPAETVGGVVNSKMVAIAVDVQPFAGFVTSKL